MARRPAAIDATDRLDQNVTVWIEVTQQDMPAFVAEAFDKLMGYGADIVVTHAAPAGMLCLHAPGGRLPKHFLQRLFQVEQSGAGLASGCAETSTRHRRLKSLAGSSDWVKVKRKGAIPAERSSVDSEEHLVPPKSVAECSPHLRQRDPQGYSAGLQGQSPLH